MNRKQSTDCDDKAKDNAKDKAKDNDTTSDRDVTDNDTLTREEMIRKVTERLNSLKKFSSDNYDELMYTIDGMTGIMQTPHTSVNVFSPFVGFDIKIDKKIAPLIRAMWRLNIRTLNSCEDNVPKGYVWIEFDTSEDLKRFLDLTFEGIRSNFDSEDETELDQITLNHMDIHTRALKCYPHQKDAWKYCVDHDIDDMDDIDEDKDEDDTDSLTSSDSSQKIDKVYNVRPATNIINVNISLRFPFKDLDFVTSQMEKQVAKIAKRKETRQKTKQTYARDTSDQECISK